MSGEIIPAEQGGPVDENGEQQPKSVVARQAKELSDEHRFIQFRNRAMVLVQMPFPHYIPLRKEHFDKLAYPMLGGQTRSRMNDIFSYICSTADDFSENEHLITFGSLALPDDYDPFEDDAAQSLLQKTGYHTPLVWDTQDLSWKPELRPTDCVWRSPFSPLGAPQEYFGPLASDEEKKPRIEFIMQLAGNDTGLYDDIMQSIAPIIMDRKPDGVVWWVGDGANGKSTLMDALYRIFPGQFSSITVKRLVDGRDTPSLNGNLANIVKESSEGRVDDTEVYKSIGTHENFRVHKFHSQDDIEIRGNLHHIFSGNSIPTFNDKGYSARRRTFIIPFGQRFDSDPTFESRTFTEEFFGALVREMGKYAQQLKRQGYRYKWSAATLAAKADYDKEASNAEDYAGDIIKQGVVAFTSFQPVRMDYENWCAENGYVPLGIGNLRKALGIVGFERLSKRSTTGSVSNIYRLKSVEGNAGLQQFGMGRPGMFTLSGFEVEPEEEPTPKPEQEKLIDGW